MRDGSGGCSSIAEGIGSSEGDTGRLGAIDTELKNTCMARKNIATVEKTAMKMPCLSWGYSK